MRYRLFFIVLILSLILEACGQSQSMADPTQPAVQETRLDSSNPFVSVSNGKFMLAGKLYYFVGTNFWQGMNLGAAGPSGNREMLVQQLDQLKQIGVTNLRIMASSEGPNIEPFRMVPALMIAPGEYDESVLDGLDFLLAEMGKRDLKAVMVLNNFWQWSGGMAQYVSWQTKTSIPYPGNWETFVEYSAKFYTCSECQAWYRDHIAMLVNHANPYTGISYRDDPIIFSWELANEPRRYPDNWIDDTAAYIKSLDPNHMITTGSEGTPPGERMDYIETHNGPNIDYATIHIWPQNWGWFDPKNPSTYNSAEVQAIMYFQNHVKDAAAMGKPLVLEEFGLARDWEPVHDIYDPDSRTTYRDLFYSVMYQQVFDSASSSGAAGGDNFWAWSGVSRPGYPWVGDPPHETPGWYSVYDNDTSTITIITTHANQMRGLIKSELSKP